MADDHRNPMFKTARALGSARPSTLSCVPHGKPTSFQFPEGALIALYHFRDSVVAFQVDRRFDCLLQEASVPATARVIRIVVMER